VCALEESDGERERSVGKKGYFSTSCVSTGTHNTDNLEPSTLWSSSHIAI
jgi:hypothetical protein